jgi:hypothetical protein
MKEKLHKDVVRIGSKNVDIENLEHYEAIFISIVGILSLAVGTIYANILI